MHVLCGGTARVDNPLVGQGTVECERVALHDGHHQAGPYNWPEPEPPSLIDFLRDGRTRSRRHRDGSL